MNESLLFYLARKTSFPTKESELKDQIDQVIKVAQRKRRNEQLLLEMLPLSF